MTEPCQFQSPMLPAVLRDQSERITPKRRAPREQPSDFLICYLVIFVQQAASLLANNQIFDRLAACRTQSRAPTRGSESLTLCRSGSTCASKSRQGRDGYRTDLASQLFESIYGRQNIALLTERRNHFGRCSINILPLRGIRAALLYSRGRKLTRLSHHEKKQFRLHWSTNTEQSSNPVIADQRQQRWRG